MLTSETLNLAADLIQLRGWAKGKGWHPDPDAMTPVCTEGALDLAAEGDRRSPAYYALRDYLTTSQPQYINRLTGYVIPFTWNDWPDRTQAEVIEVLRATAVIESARENESAQVTA